MDFLPSFDQLLQYLTWRNILDVSLVTALFFNLLLLIQGTRAVQILFGVFVLAASYYLAIALELAALETALAQTFAFLPFLIIVLFQQEIRRALASFWRTPLLSGMSSNSLYAVVDDVVAATSALADRRIGALIVFERNEGLRDYIETGIVLDSLLSLDLLINLFTPDTPTHDGAVIIQGDRIAAATCFLPLTQNPELSKSFGTRHRAALGITEETDAIAVTVSEETGAVSMTKRGVLERQLDPTQLRNLLFARLAVTSGELDR